MPFNVTFSKTPGIPGIAQKDLMFALTNLGKQQVEGLTADDTDFPVMSVLASRRAMNIEDISKETKMSPEKVMFELKRLMKQGMVRTIGSGGE